jgi:cytochrome P450
MTKSNIPTIPGEFFFNNARDFNRDTLQFILDSRQHGDFVRMNYGPFPLYILNNPALIHQVLVTDASKYYKSRNLKIATRPVIGDGLFTNDGDSWKRQRKLAQPAFHTKRIASYADIMVKYAQELTTQWQENQTIDVDIAMAHLTMQIISKTVFDAEVDGTDTISTAITIALSSIDKRTKNVFSLPLWIPTSDNRKFNEAIDLLDKLIQQFIDERRASKEDKGDLLRMLIDAQDEENGSGMSDKQLRDECMTIFGAGHETTAVTLTWTLYLLSQHPNIANKLYTEIDSVLQGQAATFTDLPQLRYTDMVIKESMRLYPAAWGVSREAIVDVEIGEHTLPKGSLFLVNLYGMHRNEAYFPDALSFKPERFSPENEKNILKGSYIPFGGGPRVCIGNSFATMEAVLALATLLQHHRFELADGHLVEPARLFTLRPKFGMKMVIKNRQSTPELA